MDYIVLGETYRSPEPTTYALQVKKFGRIAGNEWRERMFVKYIDDPFVAKAESILRMMENVPMWGANLFSQYTINVKNPGRFLIETPEYYWLTGLPHNPTGRK